tara:strand:+ start:21573 stop:23717 length:2145 start_codon:yes stop_codon:yes gene_type:complete
MDSITLLSKKLSGYLEPKKVQQVHKAYELASKAHSGQFRSSGDPYVSHPIAVAQILSSFKMDEDSLSAAMLHDVIEDTDIKKAKIEKRFNKDVAELVDGVSKLDKLRISSTDENQAENLQKMILAMSKDIRVIVVKLADRLHNMRTLSYLDKDKQIRIAKETLEIYAPIAQRIGMNNIYRELEDLSFKTIYPVRFNRLVSAVKKNRGGKQKTLNKIEKKLSKRLLDNGIPSVVEGREKHIYSIYRKMKERRRSFSEIMDVYAIKIIVDNPVNCYTALGQIHSLFKPVEGRFKDYIAIPKSNGYQSIHTGVMGSEGFNIEVQIKTQEMDEMAENGIASHWLYKTGSRLDTRPQKKARKWVANLLELKNNFDNSEEFINSIKTDLFPDEIYVFTPKGDIIELSYGSTAVDFAYAVHTDVGHHTRACRINKKISPLSLPLESGQTVEILQNKLPQTSPAWLNFVVTPRARNAIRQYLGSLKISEARKLGKALLEQSMGSIGLKLKDIDNNQLRSALDHIGVKSLNKLLEEIGLGHRVGNIVAQQMSGLIENSNSSNNKKYTPLEIKGSEGIVLNYATCCRPIPGDSVLGHFTSEKGLVVHQERCKNILSIREDPSQCFPLNWGENLDKEFVSAIKVSIKDEPGVLANLASSITQSGTNIISIDTTDSSAETVEFVINLQVKDRLHLSKILRKIRSLKSVLSTSRIHDQEMRNAKTLH